MWAIRLAFAPAVIAWLFYALLHPWLVAVNLDVSGADVFVGLTLALLSLVAMAVGLVLALANFLRDPPHGGAVRTVSAVSLGLLVAWIVLVVLIAGSRGYVLTEPAIVCGTLATGVVGGLFYASPPPRRVASWLGWFAVGLCGAVIVATGLSWLTLFGAMTVSTGTLTSSSLAAGPRVAGLLVWVIGWSVAEVSWRAGRRPFTIGLSAGTLEVGLLFMGETYCR